MSGNIVLGIDLGTTNSVVAVADGDRAQVLADLDGQKLIPSVVSFLPDGKVITGDLARERRLVDAKNTVYAIKRLIGRPFDSPEVQRAQERFAFQLVAADNGGVRVDIRGEQWTLAEISAYVLRECRRVAEQVLEQTCNKAVITVPANFNELQRSATKAAGKVAGLDVLRILNEPTAAAVAYGYGAEEAETVAVYDFGGGTFDITILELDDDVFEVVSTAGDTFLGGDDIDLLIAEDMADAFFKIHKFDPRSDPQVFERLRASAEWAKCVLSRKPLVKVSLPDLAKGRGGKDLGLEFHTTRMKLEDRIRPLLDRSLDVCADALKQASLEAKSIDRVVMVGGSTRIPLVHTTVAEFFGQEGHREMDPDLVVALGAAIQAFALAEGVPRKTLSMIKPPSAAAVQEVKKKKETARMERPAQPAFAVPPPVPAMPVVAVGDFKAPADPRLAPPYVPPAPGKLGGVERAPAPEEGDGSEPLDDLASFEIAFDEAPDLTDELEELASAPATPETPLPGLPPVLQTLDSLEAEGLGGDYGFGDLDIDLPPARTPGDPDPGGAGAPTAHDASAHIDLPPAAPASIPQQQQAMDMDEDRVVPTLMDVTPHSLGIRTAGGWCEHVIRRNAPIPVEQIRLFTTAQDGQDTVHVVVSQGESRAYEENQPLGEIVLTGLRQARRGEVHIEVTFMLDANGTLDVEARDKDTGQVQTIRIKLVGGFSDDELQAMRQRQEARVG